LRGCDALIGFDSDHRENKEVCRQLGKLLAEREQDTLRLGQKNSTGVVIWEGAKGIDDAALLNVRLRVVGIHEWAGSLRGKPLDAVNEVWGRLSFAPEA
jgi:hypothetical protein